jgi:polyisoprenoid-binding protein YceI
MKALASLLTSLLITTLVGHAAAGSLAVDTEKCRIQVDIRATGHGFTADLKKFTAKVAGDETTLQPTTFDLDWSFKDLDSDNDDRDKQMVDWLGGGEPKGSFQFVKSWTDAKGATYAEGKLTINKTTKTISFPYTAKKDGSWVTISGKATMDYEDFGLPIIRSMGLLKVAPELIVRFHVVGKVE